MQTANAGKLDMVAHPEETLPALWQSSWETCSWCTALGKNPSAPMQVTQPDELLDSWPSVEPEGQGSGLGRCGSLDALQQVVVQLVHRPALLTQLALHHGDPPGCIAAQVRLQSLQLLHSILQALLALCMTEACLGTLRLSSWLCMLERSLGRCGQVSKQLQLPGAWVRLEMPWAAAWCRAQKMLSQRGSRKVAAVGLAVQK